jgi:hypothetical protein
MFDKFFYYATTFAESVVAIFGVSGVFEQPSYTVRQDLGGGLEIRDYGQAAAVEAWATGATNEQAAQTAFRLLFGYITGDNVGGQTIAMTTPVRRTSSLIAMTTPVRVENASTGGVTMWFYLPEKNAADPPKPLDPTVRVVTIPPSTVAALRFSGNPTEQSRTSHRQELLTRLAATQWRAQGEPYLLGYDPPFTIPFLKRNEVAVAVTANSH